MGSLDIPALIIATTLSIHGLQKGSLRLDGALAAFLFGYGHLANPLRVFGVGLIFFYLAGSRATKVKIHVKAKLEDGPNPLRPGGNRSALQVLTNSLPSLLAALYFRFRVSFAMKYAYCPFDYDLPKKLVYIALAQLATNFGDTLASELGILSTHQPRYIFTLKRVPKGTNGAISLWGTIMSIVGGGSIALVMVVCLAIERSCQGLGWAWEMVVFGCYMGFCGSLLDTILGALFQETLYSPKDQKILTDLSHRPGERVIRIGIGRNVLGNSTVNFLSGTIMAIVGYYYA